MTMSDYIQKNKQAWEASFEHRTEAFDRRTEEGLLRDPEGFFSADLKDALTRLAFPKARLAQLCANNGRETIASLALGYEETVGFDIASNMVAYANDLAKRLHKNASFHAVDVLTLTQSNAGSFDVVLVTVGALTWLEDLPAFFLAAKSLLVPGGTLLIEDMHPFVNMLACKDEAPFDTAAPSKPVYDYFVKRPWGDVDSMTYMTEDQYQTKDFTSFAHTMGDIVSACAAAGLLVSRLREFPADRSDSFSHLDHTGLPLTYLLEAVNAR
jgi:SAM-dependent methyltransferase